MKTNFQHLKEYPEYFESAKSIEKQILSAKNQTERKMAGNAIRQMLESLLAKLLKKHGLQSSKIAEDLKLIRQKKIMDKRSIDNLYKIRDLGNAASHQKDSFSKAELYELYRLVYEESYRMVEYYLTDKAVSDYKKAQKERAEQNNYQKQTYHNQKKKCDNQKQSKESKESNGDGWLAVAIGLAAVVACLLLVI